MLENPFEKHIKTIIDFLNDFSNIVCLDDEMKQIELKEALDSVMTDYINLKENEYKVEE